MKLPLSVVILAHNEEDVIEDAIESALDFASEIIVINSESTDKTAEVARKKGAKVIPHTFKNFSDQRNFAVTKTSKEWVLFLDSDERLTSEFKKEASHIINNYDFEGPFGGYFIKRKTFFFGKDWGSIDKVQRLFYKKRFVKWYGIVHESAEVKGDFGEIHSPILHFTHRSLSQMVEKTNKWSDLEAKLRYDANHPPMRIWRFVRVMMTGFIQSFFKEGGYKNGTAGMIEAMYQAFSMFVTYAKLWEMQRGKKT